MEQKDYQPSKERNKHEDVMPMNHTEKEGDKCNKCHIKDCPRDETCNAGIKEYCNKLVHSSPTEYKEESLEKELERMIETNWQDWEGDHLIDVDPKKFISRLLTSQEQKVRFEIENDYINWVIAESYGRKYTGKTNFNLLREKANARDMKSWS